MTQVSTKELHDWVRIRLFALRHFLHGFNLNALCRVLAVQYDINNVLQNILNN